MKKARFSEEQVVRILQEVEAGARLTETCGKYGISDVTFYKWREKDGGVQVADVRRLKPLEGENSRRKQLLAEAMLDKRALKDVLTKQF